MNILVIGSGGREHALVKALKASPSVESLFCAPGNGGIARDAECVTLDGAEATAAFCRERNVEFVVIGPEQPLVDGLADDLREAGVLVFGPSKAAAMLEASKGFTKDLCREANIPTGDYARFDDPVAAKEYLARQGMPIVIKADGLAAGKGVVIATRRREAERVIDEMFSGSLGEAGASVVIEEFLDGEELSFFALCHGTKAVEFGSAQDHKAAYDGDTGPNTGGMGTYAPAPAATADIRRAVMETIIAPTLKTMEARGTPYSGVLFAGLMLTREGPKLIEYNARFGDPETQVLLPRLKDDLALLLKGAAEGRLPPKVEFSDQAAVCVVMAAKGYPGEYAKGHPIEGLECAEAIDGVTVYHAGTRADAGRIHSHGGRVLGITALGADVAEAQATAYKAVDTVVWPEGFCRRDIGWRAIKRSA